MSDPAAQLEQEIARLAGEFAALADRPEIQASVRAELIIRAQQLAALRAAEPTAGGDTIRAGDIRNSNAVALGRGAVAISITPPTVDEAQRLGEAIDTALAEMTTALQAEPAHAIYPYLRPYGIADHARFAGRAERCAALYEQLQDSPIVVLTGGVGVGKTSLLQAGLIPMLLRNRRFPLLVNAATPIATRIKSSLRLPADEHTERLAAQPLAAWLDKTAHVATELVIILDQFELFLEQASPEEQQHLWAEIAATMRTAQQRCRWIIAVRSSHQDRLADLERSSSVRLQPFILGGLDQASARAAIIEPAAQRGIQYEPSVVEQMLLDLCDNRPTELIDPSRLQIVCTALIQTGARTIEPALYRQVGGAQQIMQSYLDTILKPNDPAWTILAIIAEQPRYALAPEELRHAAGLRQLADIEPLLLDLEQKDLLVQSDSHDEYRLASVSFLPRIREWSYRRAVEAQALVEFRKQLDYWRRSSLRGGLGGALGFGLAYLITAIPALGDFLSVLIFVALFWSLIPGSIAGVCTILGIDIAHMVATRTLHPSWRWPIAALGGALGFGLAYALHRGVSLAASGDSNWIIALASAALEGGLWGALAGMGILLIRAQRRALHWSLLIGSVPAGIALVLFEPIGRVFHVSQLNTLIAAPLPALLLAGIVQFACLTIAAGRTSQAGG